MKKRENFQDLNGRTDVYFVLVNGNQLCCVDSDLKVAHRSFERWRKRDYEVSLWYCYSDNSIELLDCAN